MWRGTNILKLMQFDIDLNFKYYNIKAFNFFFNKLESANKARKLCN